MILKKIDLRTDCINMPTEEMRKAMRNAKIGNDDIREDPTINQLERLAVKKLGKESALFILNGTMANIIAIYTHCKPGDKIIMEKEFHLYHSEIGGIEAICRVEPIYVESNKGIPQISKLLFQWLEAKSRNYKISLICLENPHNKAGGIITPPNIMNEIYEMAQGEGIPIHLDGARIFNASLSLGIDASELTRYVDSVMLCLNKGLGAPVGAILAGSEEFIKQARKNRKLLGGHMRQMGIMAAAGIVAINKMEERLNQDNENAKILGKGLSGIEGISIGLGDIQVNKVHANIEKLGISNDKFLDILKEYNIFAASLPPSYIFFRTHHGISKEDIYTTIKAVKNIVKNR